MNKEEFLKKIESEFKFITILSFDLDKRVNTHPMYGEFSQLTIKYGRVGDDLLNKFLFFRTFVDQEQFLGNGYEQFILTINEHTDKLKRYKLSNDGKVLLKAMKYAN